MESPRGFTLVELITVIMLLGILSAVAIARGGKASDFNPRMATASAAEQYRFAHGLATGRFADPISFAVTRTGNTLQLVTTSSLDGTVRIEELNGEGLAVSIENGAANNVLGSSDSFQITFSASGDVSSAMLNATPLQPDLGIELVISGDSAHSLCVYPTGYLRTGNCV